MGIVMLLHDPVKHRQSLRSDGSKTAFRFSPRARQAITLEMGFTLCQFSAFLLRARGQQYSDSGGQPVADTILLQRFSPREKSANRCAQQAKSENRPAMGIHTIGRL